jgi:VWFA-related protein
MLISVTRAILLSLLICVSLASAQKNAKKDAPQRLIELSVAATTASGEPATDLQPGDIQLSEDGKPRPLVFFRFDGAGRKMAAPAEGEFVNRAGPTPTVLLLDRWNDRALTTAMAWNDISKALEHMESVERVYVYFLTPKDELFPVNAVPPPGADLRMPIQPAPGELRARLDEAVRKLSGVRNVDAYDPILRGNSTLQVLAGLGGQMAAMLGRKNLIWVTYGFPLEMHIDAQDIDFTPSVRAFTIQAAQAGIVMYTVQETEQGPGANPIGESLATLQTFAALTGGRSYPSGNSDSALADSRADGRGSYRVAYYSPSREGDRKEHKIRLETPRKDIHLVTRQSYVDNPPPDLDTQKDALLEAAAHSPFDASDIGLRASISTDASRQTAHLTIRVDPADVFMEHSGDKYHGHLDLVIDSYVNRTFAQASPQPGKDIDFTQDQFNQAMKDGIVLEQDLPLPGNVEALRAVVFDPVLHSVGSVVIPVK